MRGAGGFLFSRFLRSQPRRIGLGQPLGRDPLRKIDAAISRGERNEFTGAPRWASSSTPSSTICALRSAASRTVMHGSSHAALPETHLLAATLSGGDLELLGRFCAEPPLNFDAAERQLLEIAAEKNWTTDRLVAGGLNWWDVRHQRFQMMRFRDRRRGYESSGVWVFSPIPGRVAPGFTRPRYSFREGTMN